MKCLSLKYHHFLQVLLQCTLNPNQNQGLIRFIFIWNLVPMQKHLGDLLCPKFQETDNFILNQPPKSLEKTILGFLKSTSYCKLQTKSFKNSASSRIFSMENWRREKSNLNSTKTKAWNTCWNSFTKWERLASDENGDSMLISFNTFRTSQLQLMYKYDFFVGRRTTSSSKWHMSATPWMNSRSWYKIWKTFLIFNNVRFNKCVIF